MGMYQTIGAAVKDWHARYGERAKLQHAYFVVGVAGILLAGVLSLFDSGLSEKVLIVAVITLSVMVINSLFWALIYGLVLAKLPTPRRRKQ